MEYTLPHQNAQARTPNSREVYLALKEDILTLNLRPGQKISENEVAGLYNVSRTPAKNAFIRLESEGFIEIVPQRGTFVTRIDFGHIQSIIYMRYVLEVDMCKTILKQPYLGDILEKLEQNLEEQKRLIADNKANPSSFYEVDSQFHALLFSYVGKDQIWSIIQANQVYYTRFRLLYTRVTARYEQLYAEHAAIVQALRDRDLARVDKYIFDHLHINLPPNVEPISAEHKDYLINY